MTNPAVNKTGAGPPSVSNGITPDVAERVRSDPVLLQHLVVRVGEEIDPILKSACTEDAAVTHMFNWRTIIDVIDRLVAIEQSRFLALNHVDQMVPLAEGDVASRKSRGFLEAYEKLVDRAKVKKHYTGPADDFDKLIKQVEEKTTALILNYIRTYRYANTIKRSIDVFTETSQLEVKDQIATFTQPHTALMDRVSDLSTMDECRRVMADFGEHFPEFDDFMAILCAARFAPDRRKAFLWLHAPAGWGKGLLMSALSNLSLVTSLSEKDVEAAFEGKPLGLDPDEATRSWALWFDEVKRVKSELKMLNNEITMTPKYQKRTKVPVFAKIFTSAEGVDSLAGENGVEAQFSDRFAYMAGTGKIDQRPLFKELGAHAYINGLAFGMAKVIDHYVDDMRDLGKSEAYLTAEQQLGELHEKYRIDKALGSLDDTLLEMADELAQLMRSAGEWQQLYGQQQMFGLPRELRVLPENLLKRLMGDLSLMYLGGDREPVYVLRRAVSFVKEWISFRVDRSESVKVVHKAAQVCQMASMRSVKSPQRLHSSSCGGHGDHGELVKGVVIPRKKVTADAAMVTADAAAVSFL